MTIMNTAAETIASRIATTKQIRFMQIASLLSIFLYERIRILVDKGLFCDLVYIVLWKAGRRPKSKYAERVPAKHPATFDKRFIHPRPERKED